MISIDPQLVKDMVASGKRIDNRKLDEYRDIKIEKGFVTSAEGSARVKLGNTEVLAGVKFGVGEPFADTPDDGVLMVGAEFVPLASPDFESGPPGEEAIETARVVDRAIRESKVIDFKQLCIKPKEKTWMVYVDIDILDNDGNLIDACSIAAISALLDAKLPELDEDFSIDTEKERTKKLPITGVPISTTIARIGNKLVVDPTLSEELALDSRLTVGTFDKNGEIMLSSMQKGGTGGLSLEEIDKMVSMAEHAGKKIRAAVLES